MQSHLRLDACDPHRASPTDDNNLAVVSPPAMRCGGDTTKATTRSTLVMLLRLHASAMCTLSNNAATAQRLRSLAMRAHDCSVSQRISRRRLCCDELTILLVMNTSINTMRLFQPVDQSSTCCGLTMVPRTIAHVGLLLLNKSRFGACCVTEIRLRATCSQSSLRAVDSVRGCDMYVCRKHA